MVLRNLYSSLPPIRLGDRNEERHREERVYYSLNCSHCLYAFHEQKPNYTLDLGQGETGGVVRMLVCEAGALCGCTPCLVGEGIPLSCPHSPILPSTVKSRMCCFSGSSNSEPSSATQERYQKELALPSTPSSLPVSLQASRPTAV